MFTSTSLQAVTYLLGVSLFSISFLVFLNSSISFVVTDLIQESEGVGDAVGSLGFADELVALIACPAWGMISDRVGVRPVLALLSVVPVTPLTFWIGLRDRLCHHSACFSPGCSG
jgi:MFS family permease